MLYFGGGECAVVDAHVVERPGEMALVEITSNASLAYPDRRIECLRIGSVEPSVHIDTRSGAVGRKCAHMPFAVVDNRIGIPKRVERIHIELAGTSVDIEKYTPVLSVRSPYSIMLRYTSVVVVLNHTEMVRGEAPLGSTESSMVR